MANNKGTQMTKILILSHISEYVGGAEKSLLDVIDTWSEQFNVEPVFILKKPVGTMKVPIEEKGWKYYGAEYTFWSESNPPNTSEKKYIAALKNARAIQSIEKIIKAEKPDIVITNSVVCPWAALAAYYQKVPHVWFVREYGDLDHGRAYEIGREKTLEDVGNLSELVVANSKTLSEHLAQYINPDKLTTLYNPFNIKNLNEKAEAKIKNPFKSNDSLKLVLTGSPAPSKGQLEAIKAVANLNQKGYSVELCVVGGNGPKEYRKKLQQEVKENKLKNKVHMVGHQSNPLAFAALADAGIMASRKEAFGRVTFEYMAIGKPVIGSNSGATPELVTDGLNGQLFNPGSVASLTKAIKKYADDKNLLKTHGKKSKEIAENMMDGGYNANNVYEKIVEVLSSANKVPTINYTHTWLDYPQIANDFIIETGQISVKKLAYKRARTRAGNVKRIARQAAKKVIKR